METQSYHKLVGTLNTQTVKRTGSLRGTSKELTSSPITPKSVHGVSVLFSFRGSNHVYSTPHGTRPGCLLVLPRLCATVLHAHGARGARWSRDTRGSRGTWWSRGDVRRLPNALSRIAPSRLSDPEDTGVQP